MPKLIDYLSEAVNKNASDIFVVAGAPVSIKAGGEMRKLDEDKLMPDRTLELITEVYELSKRGMENLLKTGDDDFSFALAGLARFRVNTYRQRGSYAMVIRVVSFKIPSREEILIPEELMKLSQLSHGMVLFTGIAGSGKSTTQACIIDRINTTRACHVITLEDPIEYLHKNKKSIVNQREINTDTENFASALRASMRQAPDVILVGEMRDRETIHAAITAAETGHLVLATLHTNGAVNAIDRIIDSFPPEGQQQIRQQLSMVLETVVSQQLLPGLSRERVPAFEILQMTTAVRSMIRDGKTYLINNAIATGSSEGMLSMDKDLQSLFEKELISAQTAVDYSYDPKLMRRRLKLVEESANGNESSSELDGCFFESIKLEAVRNNLYKKEEVDKLLKKIKEKAVSAQRLTEQTNRKIEKLENKLAVIKKADDSAKMIAENIIAETNTEAEKTLAAATAEAEEIVEKAKQEARALIKAGEESRSEIIARANRKKDVLSKMIDEAWQSYKT